MDIELLSGAAEETAAQVKSQLTFLWCHLSISGIFPTCYEHASLGWALIASLFPSEQCEHGSLCTLAFSIHSVPSAQAFRTEPSCPPLPSSFRHEVSHGLISVVENCSEYIIAADVHQALTTPQAVLNPLREQIHFMLSASLWGQASVSLAWDGGEGEVGVLMPPQQPSTWFSRGSLEALEHLQTCPEPMPTQLPSLMPSLMLNSSWPHHGQNLTRSLRQKGGQWVLGLCLYGAGENLGVNELLNVNTWVQNSEVLLLSPLYSKETEARRGQLTCVLCSFVQLVRVIQDAPNHHSCVTCLPIGTWASCAARASVGHLDWPSGQLMRETTESRGCGWPPGKGQEWCLEWHRGRSWTMSFFTRGWLYRRRLGQGHQEGASGSEGCLAWAPAAAEVSHRACPAEISWLVGSVDMCWRFQRKLWKRLKESWYLSIFHDEGPWMALADSGDSLGSPAHPLPFFSVLEVSARRQWEGGQNMKRHLIFPLWIFKPKSQLNCGKINEILKFRIRLDWVFNIQDGGLTNTWHWWEKLWVCLRHYPTLVQRLKSRRSQWVKNKTISWLCLFHIQPLPETGIITQTSSTLILILQARKLRIRTSADLLVMGSWTSNKQTNKNLGKQTHATGIMQLFDGDRPPETVCTVDFSWETLLLSTCWTLGCDIPIKSYGSNYISI